MNEFHFDLQRFDETTVKYKLEQLNEAQDGKKYKLSQVDGSSSETGTYETLTAAFAAATEGATIQLSGNITTSVYAGITKKLTLDLNNYNLTRNGANPIVISGNGDLTVTDTSNEGKGYISGTYNTIFVGNGTSGNFTLEGGTIKSTTGKSILARDGSTVSIKGGSIESTTKDIFYDVGTGNSIAVTGGSFNADVSQYIKNVETGAAGTYDTDYTFVDDTLYVGQELVAEKLANVQSSYNTEIDGVTKHFTSETTQNNATNGCIAKIGEKVYSTLQKAVDLAQDGDTIKLAKDDAGDVKINRGIALTIDLNGCTVGTNTSWNPIVLGNQGDNVTKESIVGNKLTIINSNSSKAGSLTGQNGIAVMGGLIEDLTSGGTTYHPTAGYSEDNPYSTLILGTNDMAGTINVSCGVDSHGVYGNGSYWNFGTDITVNKGVTITSPSGPGIYNPQNGKLTINDGATILGGEAAIEIRSGELEINGGTFKAFQSTETTDETTGKVSATYNVNTTATEYTYVGNGNGSTTTGAAIAVSQHTTKQPLKVTINGGTFDGAVALSVTNPQQNQGEGVPTPEVTINDGTFTGNYQAVVTNQTSVPGISQGSSSGTGTDANPSIEDTSANNVDGRVTVTVNGGKFNGGFAAIARKYKQNGTTGEWEATSESGGYVLKTATFNDKNYLPSGYVTNENYTGSGTTWTVQFNAAVAQINGKDYTNFDDAIADALAAKTGEQSSNPTQPVVITVLSDNINLNASGYTINSGNIVLDLNGHTLKTNTKNETLFTVTGSSTNFTIRDTSTTSAGKIEFGASSVKANTGLIKVTDSATFNMTSGTLSSEYTAVRVTGATANINGGSIIVNGEGWGSSAYDGYAIAYDAASKVNIGQAGMTGPTITVTTTTEDATDGLSAIYGIATTAGNSNTSALNIYGGTISAGNSQAGINDYAVWANGGSVNISGGSLTAQEAGIFVSSDTKLNIRGGAIEATDSAGNAIYLNGTSTATIAGGSTSVTGGKYAVFNKSTTANNVKFGVGTTFKDSNNDAVTPDAYAHYETATADSGTVYSFVGASMSAVDGGYNFIFDGSANNGYVDGAETLKFAGNLFDKNSLAAAVSDISIDENSQVNIASTDNFVQDDGASLKVDTTNYTLNTTLWNSETPAISSPFRNAGDYSSSAVLSTLESDVDSVKAYSYHGIGASVAGFNAKDNALTYHTAWDGIFTLSGSVSLGSDALTNVGSYVTVNGSTVSIGSGFFAANQTTGAAMSISGSTSDNVAYTLSLAEDITTSLSENPSFAQVTTTEDEATTHAYVYTFEGAKKAGYILGEGSSVVTYHAAADTLSFADDGVYDGSADDTLINFNSTIPADAKQWFTVDKDNKLITVAAGAFSATQGNGAYLSLAGGEYTLRFADGIVADSSLYSDSNKFTLTTGSENDVNRYLFTTPGMSVGSGKNYIMSVQGSGANTLNALTYYATSDTVGLSASGISLSTDTSSVDALYSFNKDAKTFTIQTLSAFTGTWDEGDSISLTGSDYTLKIGGKIVDTLTSAAINGTATYSAATRTYTGIGASVAGFETTAGGVYTYHEKYDQFTLAGGNNSIAVSNDFAKYVGIETEGTVKTIGISVGAFSSADQGQGQYFSLASGSANIYKIDLVGDGWDIAKGKLADEATFSNANSAYYRWNSAGASTSKGYKVSDDNDKITYYKLQDKVDFTRDNENGIQFSTDTTMVAGAISLGSDKVSIDAKALVTPTDKWATLGFYGDSTLSMALAGDNTVFADGTLRKAAEMTSSGDSTLKTYEYGGQGASSRKGYTVEGGNVLNYYGQAELFTLSGDLALNTDASMYTAANGNITIGAGAFASGATSGQYISLTGGNYTLNLADSFAGNSVAFGASDIQKFATVAATSYTGIGVTDKEYAYETASNQKGFTYYGKSDMFTVSGSDGFGFNTSLTADQLKSALTVSGAAADGTKTVAISDSTVFTGFDNGETLGIDTAGYKFSLGGDNITVLGTEAVHKATTLTGEVGSYSYVGLGGETAGFYQGGSESSSVITYYGQSEKFSIEGSIVLDTESINSKFDNFIVDGANNKVTIGAGAIKTDDLTNGASFSIKAAAGESAYTINFASDLQSSVISNASNVQKSATVAATSYTGMGVTTGETMQGYLLNGTDAFNYYDKADMFTVSGSDGFGFNTSLTADQLKGALTVSGDAGNKTVTIGDATVFTGYDNGETLKIDTANYKFAFGSGVATISKPNEETLTASGNSYSYVGRGGDSAGFYQGDNKNIIAYYTASEKFGLTGNGITLNTASITADKFKTLFVIDGEKNIVTIGAGAISTTGLANGAELVVASGDYTLRLGSDVTTVNSTAAAAVQAVGNDSKAYEYKFAGAERDGFELKDDTHVDYYTAADRFTIESSKSANFASSSTDIILGNIDITNASAGTIKLKDALLATSGLSTGDTIAITNHTGSTDYKLALQDNSSKQAADIQATQTLTGSSADGTNTYNYKGIGAGTAGWNAANGIITYYNASEEFALSGNIALNTTSINSAFDSLFIVDESDNKVTIGADAISTTGRTNGATLAVSSGNYTLELGNDVTKLNADAYRTKAELTEGKTYGGIGGKTTDGFVAASDNKSFTYYDKADSFTLNSGAGYVSFGTNVADTLIENAIQIGEAVNSVKGVTVNNFGLFTGLSNGATLSLDENSAKLYSLVLGADQDSTVWNTLTDAQVQSVGAWTDTIGSDNSVSYTGKGSKDKAGAGFATLGGGITYYDKAETFTISSSAAFSLNSANLIVDIDTTNNSVTINSGAFDTTKLVEGQTFTITGSDGDTYKLVAGTGITSETLGASIDNNNTWTGAGYRANAFVIGTGDGASVMTYHKPADSVTFTKDKLSYATDFASKVSLGSDNVVSIGSGALTTVADGGWLGFAESTKTYTFDASALVVDGNTYYDKASIGTGDGTATYTSKGMSSVDGYYYNNNPDINRIYWHQKADVVTFDTSGGIQLATSGASVITVDHATKNVTIGAGALASSVWNNTSYISLTGAGYTLATITGVDMIKSVSGPTLTDKTFKSAGADVDGYSISGGNKLTYYTKPEQVLFAGDIEFTGSEAASLISINLDHQITIDKDAFNLDTLAGDGTKTIYVAYPETHSLVNITDDGESVTLSAGGQTAAHFDTDTNAYTGIGASVTGFELKNKTFAYWKAYDKFSFATVDRAAWASDIAQAGTYFTVQAGTSATEQGTIKMATSAISSVENGAELVLSSDSATLYNFDLTGWATLDATNDFNSGVSYDTVSGVYSFEGAKKAGYLYEDKETADKLTYYTAADTFTLGAANGTSIKLNFSYTSPELLTQYITIKNNQVQVNASAFDESALLGGEKLQIINQSTANKYTLVKGYLNEATGSIASSFSFDKSKGIYQAEGARANGFSYSSEDNGILTYVRKADAVTLGGTAQFGNYDSLKVDHYFSFSGSTLTINDYSFIKDVVAGTKISIDSAHTLDFADSLEAAGTYTNQAKFDTTSKTYTGIGASESKGFSVVGGEWVYYDKSDSVTFDYNLTFSDAFTANPANYITITPAASDGGNATVKFAAGAFNTSKTTDGQYIKIADGTKDYVLDLSLDGLTDAGTYYAAPSLVSLESSGYAFHSKGSEKNGFTAGDASLVWHTARTHNFTLDGNIAFKEGDASVLGSAFTFGNPSSGNYTVTINPTLFAAATDQTDKATLRSTTDNYNLSISNPKSTVPTSFVGSNSEYTYQGEGVTESGYTLTDGVITYREVAPTFKFHNDNVYTGNTGDIYLNFKSNNPSASDIASWFTVDGKNVTVHTDEAFSSDQANKAQLSIVSGSSNVTLHYAGTNMGTYAGASIKVNGDGGASYRTEGMTGTSSGYAVTDSILTYYTAGQDITFEGGIKFSDSAAAANISISGTSITIAKDALATSQSNLATLKADGYTLAQGDLTSAIGERDTATMNRSTGQYKSAGATTAGYKVTNNILKYYDTADSFMYNTGGAPLATNIADLVKKADSPIKITGTDASGNKIVTFYKGAFADSIAEGRTLAILTEGYTVSLGADINGGNYDTERVFYADRKQLKFGGADQDGFVKQNSDDNYYTYRLASNTTPIQFVGTMNFNADINSVEAASDKYFTRIGEGNNITVKIANADIFSPYNNTGDTLTIENKADAAIKYTLQKNGIILVADGTENSIVPEAITANDSGYLYTAWGAKASAGYSDDGAGTLTYYDLSKQIQLNGDIALNTDKLNAIDFGYVTVAGSDASTTSYLKTLTIGKDALANQNVDGTLSIAGSDGYGLALNAADSITAWAHVDETLNNQTYTPEGYSQAGYQVNDNVLSYHSVSSSNIEFKGLATGITASNIGYTAGSKEISLAAAAFGAGGTDNASVKVVTGGYTLKLGTGQDASVDVSADLKGQVYTTKGTSAGYELLNNTQINYYAKTGQDSIEFSGLASTATKDDITVDGKVITLAAAAISTTAGSNTVSVKTANYTFAQGDLTKSVYLDKATLESGVYKTAGYDNTGYSLGSANREISYFAENNADITLSGLKTGASENNIASDSSITITLSAGALGADVVSIEGATKSGTTADYKLALGSDVGKSVYLAGPTLTSGVYKTAGVDEAGHSLAADGKSISYQAEGNVDITLSGLKEGATADYILFADNSNVITLKADALGTAVVSIEGATKNGETASFTLALDSGVTKAQYVQNTLTADGVYKTAGYDNTGYSLAADGKSINYFAENNVDITLSGLKTGATASNISSDSSTVITLGAGALDTQTVSITGATKNGTSADYTLALSDDVEKSILLSGATLTNDGVYKTAGYDNDGYSLAADSKSINYFAENNEDITLTGLATGTTVDKIGYTAKSAVLALAEAAIGTNNTVSVENSGYTFNLSSVTAANYLATATLSSNKTTYTPEGYTSAGYALGSDSRSIRYQAQTSENITFSGLSTNAAANDITVAGTAITLGQNALGTSDVQVGGNYTLNLVGAVNNVYTRTAAQGATYTNSTGVYKNASGPETFTVDGNKATYQSITGGEEITFTGLGSGASTVNVAFDGNSTFTIGSAALGKSSITATGAGTYALKLADADSSGKYIATPADIASYKDNVYTAATTDEFYQASNSSVIAYTEATGGQKATFNGLASDAEVGDFTFDGNSNFTLAAHALDSTKTASVAGSYKLALGDDVTKSQTLGNQYSNNVFTSSGDTEGYKLSDNKISYTEDTTTKFTFSGVASGATGSSFYLSTGNNQIAIGLAAVDTLGTTLKLTGTPDDGNDYTLRLGKGMTASRTLTEAEYDSGVYQTKGITNVGYELGSDSKSITYNTEEAYAANTSKSFTFEGVADGAEAGNFYLAANNQIAIGLAAVDTLGTTLKLTGTPDDGNDYTLRLGKGMTAPTDLAAELNGQVYTTAGNTAGYVLDNTAKTITYKAAAAQETITFSGLASTATKDDITVDGNVITIAKNALGTDEVSVSGNYTLKLADDVTQSESISAAKYADGVYTTAGTTTGYTLADNKISYVEGTSKSFTFEGVADGAEAKNFYISGNNITIGLDAVKTDGTAVKLTDTSDGKEYNLKLGKGMTSSRTLTAAEYDSGVYQTKGITNVGYELSDDKQSIKYNTAEAYAANTSKSFTFTGVADDATASNFYLSGSNLTIGLAAVKTDGTAVKLTDTSDGKEYNLKLGKGMTSSRTLSAAEYDSGVYQTKGITNVGYELSDDKQSIKYNTEKAYAANTSKSFTFEGVADGAEAKNFYLSGSNITIGLDAVKTDGTAVKLTETSDGGSYNLKLGRGMTSSRTLSAAEYDSGVYQTKGITNVGYELSDDKQSIKYNTAEAYAANTSKSFTFTGVADDATASNFYLSGSNITIGLDAVKTDGTEVKLTDTSDGKEYNLKLGKGMTSSRTLTAAEYDSGVYQTKGITNVGYELSNDKQSIKYNTAEAYAANTSKSFTFTGVADGAEAKNFYLSGSNITIGLAAVKTDGTAVKLTDTSDGEDYNLKLGKGMTAATTTASLSGSKYTVNYSKAGYNLNNTAKEIKYVAANTTALELNGITKAPSGVSNGIASLQTATFNKATVTSNAADYFFAIESGTYTGKTFTGSANADTVTNAGASLTINLGNGNDSIISTGNNVTINGGAGNDYIKSTGAGSSVLGGAGADTIACGGGADTIDAGAANDIVYGGSGADSIFGNSGNDSLNGAAGNDSLWGGAGNDTLTGGAGADTFIYRPSEGTDTITDYNNSQGDILRILKADGTSGTYTGATFASNTLTLTIDGGGSVVFNNVKSGSSVNINGTTHKISGSGLS